MSLLAGPIGRNPPCARTGESAVISVRRPELRFSESVLAALNKGERLRFPQKKSGSCAVGAGVVGPEALRKGDLPSCNGEGV